MLTGCCSLPEAAGGRAFTSPGWGSASRCPFSDLPLEKGYQDCTQQPHSAFTFPEIWFWTLEIWYFWRYFGAVPP